MVPELLLPLSRHIESFGAFGSVTFRAICAALTAFLVCLVMGPGIIERLRQMKWRERIASDSDRLAVLHSMKGGTPTMGGMIFVLATVLGTVFFARLSSRPVVVVLLITTAMAVLGGIDDRIKLLARPDPKRPGKTLKGMSARHKLLGQALLAIFGVVWMWIEMRHVPGWAELRVPGFPHLAVATGLGVMAFGAFVIVATTNAVNLTDGLDGLAAGCGTIVVLVMTVMAYLVGRADMAPHLGQVFVPAASEVAIFLSALAGAVCGFLWWNCHPAKVFMGNTGSLALGGALSISAVAIRQEVLLLVAGFAFVWEAFSVILQVWSFKTRGKRIFLIAPFHHHLQFKGWPESRVVMSFWIGTAFFGVIALGLQRVL